MSVNDNDDATVAGDGKPERDGSEDLTIPSGELPLGEDTSTDDDIEDPTVPMSAVGEPKQPSPPSDDATVVASDVADKANQLPSSPSQLMGETLGGCRIDKMLGRGAMGAVYKARQLKLDRDVAVKVIRPEMMTDARMLKRFEVEARTVGKFNSANVVMVHDVGFERGVHFLVMELVRGKNLRDHAKLLAGGRLPVGEALPLIRQACKGLEESRRLGVVHRDIKPDNLMLTERGVLKIADFGIAKPQEDFSMTLTSELIGTPLYMSPEQCQGGADLDFRSDMYSLGATFFYLLTGEAPIRASSVYELIQTKTKLENLCLWKALPELDENNPLSRVIERMTANNRDDRYDSYEELLNDLVLVEAGESITIRAKKLKKAIATKEAERAGQDEPQKSGSSLMLVVVMLLVAGGGVGGYQWWSSQQKLDDLDQVSPGPGEDDPIRSELEVARMKLAGLRERIEPEGPTPALRAEVAQLLVPSALADKRRQLLRDLDEGLRVEAELAALPVLDPAVPFGGVGPYFTTLEQKATVAPECGERLRAWAEARLTARRNADGQAIGEKAVAALTQKLEEWRADLGRFRGAEEDVQELQASMKQIVQGRQNLVEKLPELEEILSQSVGIDELDGLSLQLVRLAFLSGGSNRSLTISVEQVDTANAKLREQRSALLTAIDNYSKSQYPQSFKAPGFLEVPPFRDARGDALGIAEEGQELPEWLLAKRRQLLREGDLLQDVAAVCGESWRDWESDRGDEAGFEALQQALAQLKLSVRNAKQLFPGDDAAAVLDKAVPPKKLQEAERALKDDIAKASGDKMRDAWRKELKSATQQLDNLTLSTWDSDDFERKTRSLEAGYEELESNEKLALALKEFKGRCAAWVRAKTDYDAAAEELADGALVQCVASLSKLSPPSGAKPEFGKLTLMAQQCQDAFRLVEEKLDLVGAKAKLDTVIRQARAKSLVRMEAQVKTWLAGVLALENAAAGMRPIEAGNSKKPGVGFVEKAFFVSATECSNAEFGRFVEEANEAQSKLAKLPCLVGKEDQVRRILNWVPSSSDARKPAIANYYQAAAYCEWRGLSLPTGAEWALAAFGDGGSEYPWKGDDEALRLPRCNFGSRTVDVDDRGVQRNELRHLVGNVAEWLQDGGGEHDALCAGGGFTASASRQDKLARGVEFEKVDRIYGRTQDVGLRVVLRPASFAGMTWPKAWRK